MDYRAGTKFSPMVATQNHVKFKVLALQSGSSRGSSQGAEYPSTTPLFDPIPKPSVRKACRNFVEQGHFLGHTFKLEMALLYPSEVERTRSPCSGFSVEKTPVGHWRRRLPRHVLPSCRNAATSQAPARNQGQWRHLGAGPSSRYSSGQQSQECCDS